MQRLHFTREKSESPIRTLGDGAITETMETKRKDYPEFCLSQIVLDHIKALLLCCVCFFILHHNFQILA